MKKYVKLWPIVVLVILLTLSLINQIPLSLDEILNIPNDALISHCAVRLEQWDKTNLVGKDARLTEAEFGEIINMLDKDTYTNFRGSRRYTVSDGDFYTINLTYFIDGQKQLYYISIAKHGLLVLSSDGKTKEYAFSHKDKADQIVNEIYEYVHDRVEK